MKTPIVTLTYFSDPGHGWYSVKRRVLESLGLLGEISFYSYQKGGTVYLEEDRDISVLALKLDTIGVVYRLKYGSRSTGLKIRSFDRYKP